MSTVSLEELNQAKIKGYLKKLLNAEITGEFTLLPSAVNTTFVFETAKEKFVMKLMTTPTTAEWEKYRFAKVGSLFDAFQSKADIPVPKVIHIENSEEPVGYRFIIISFIEGENLGSIWRNLSQEEIIPIVKELALIVRTIHSIDFDYYGEIEEFESPSRYCDYKEKVKIQVEEYVSTILERNSLPEELVIKAQNYFFENLGQLNLPSKACLLHNDIHQGNMIVQKDAQGEYKIQAILDWEWACADNPLEDIIYIEENLLQDPEVKRIFYSEYSHGKYENLDDFAIDIKLFNILWKLDDVVCGWTFHNPTPENLANAKSDLENLLSED